MVFGSFFAGASSNCGSCTNYLISLNASAAHVFLIRSSKFSLRLYVLKFVLNFKLKCFSKVLKISRFKFLKPSVNITRLVADSYQLGPVTSTKLYVIIYKQCNIIYYFTILYNIIFSSFLLFFIVFLDGLRLFVFFTLFYSFSFLSFFFFSFLSFFFF